MCETDTLHVNEEGGKRDRRKGQGPCVPASKTNGSHRAMIAVTRVHDDSKRGAAVRQQQ